MSGYYPNVNFNSKMPSLGIQGFGTMNGHISNVESSPKASFKDVLTNAVSNVNEAISKPDDLLEKAARGDQGVDIHDVMIAMSQAEVTLTVATNAVTKVIQAYDKIVQIQV